MIPFSVSDVIKILDQIPVWKTLSQLPKKVAALEEEIGTLKREIAELRAAPAVQPGETCPACGAPALRRVSSKKSKGPFADLGARDEVWQCGACNEKDERLVTR